MDELAGCILSEESIDGELHASLRLEDSRGVHRVNVISGVLGPLQVGGDTAMMDDLNRR